MNDKAIFYAIMISVVAVLTAMVIAEFLGFPMIGGGL